VTRTAADIVAARLADAGCRHAFGLPGGEVLALMDALIRAGLTFHLVKHENAGGFMAEGVWSVDGAPGVLLATIGPGLANTVNVAANALQEQVPLLIVSGCVDHSEAERYTHQVIDHSALMRPVTKASIRLADGAVGVQMDKALALALSDPMGPVHVDLPVSLASKPQPEPAAGLVPRAAPAAPARGPALDLGRAMLAAARRPVVVAGAGAVAHGAGSDVLAFCERFGAPLVTTYRAKGLIDEAHDLSLGGHGLSPRSDAILAPLFDAADLVLTVGYDPIEMRAGWRDPWAPRKCVALDHAPALHGMHGAAVAFVCDARAGLTALADGVAPDGQAWPCGLPGAVRDRLDAAFSPPAPWGPHAVFAAAARALPPEAIVTADSGAHRILLSQMWRCPAPRTLLQSSAFCTMGAALPLAIGARIADPARPIMAVMGDAGAEMVLGELATLRDLRAPLAVLILVDESLALIELKQRASQMPNVGVDFPGTDWPAVARAFGGEGVWADDAETVERALQAALTRETFTVVAARIGRRAYDGAF
jgi:acetolactate synthase-1/2/3 large subunit